MYACVTLPIGILLIAEGIIPPTELNAYSTVIIAGISADILAYRDSFLVENLNNQQITQEFFDITGDETSSELQELEAAEAIIML